MLTVAGLLLPLLLLPRLGTGAIAHSGVRLSPATRGGNRCLTSIPVPPPRHMHWDEKEIAMRLQISDRPESQLTAWIFKLFLEEVLGYAGVELVNVPDYYNMTDYIRALTDCPNCIDHFPRFLRGQPEDNATEVEPEATINLEVWASPGDEMDRDIGIYNVMYAGPLGTVTRMGWFFQDWVATSQTEVLDHWRSFLRPEAMRVFNYTETELNELQESVIDKRTNRPYCDPPECVDGAFVPPWCQGVHCAVLLASRPEEASLVLKQISSLRLHVRVYWVGDQLAGLVRRRTADGSPVLFVHYTPSLITLRANYVEVAFPAESSFGSSYLRKMAWSKLRDGATMAEKALHAFRLTQEQYIDMLLLDRPTASRRQVACNWLRANRDDWQKWTPTGRPQILIGGIFPINGRNYKAKGVIPAAMMAVRAVNSNTSVLRDYDLTLMSNDGQCSTDMVMRSFINYVRLPQHKHMAGILGPACSDTVEPIAGVSRHYNVVVISYSAEGVLFTNRSQYPYFFRTIGENKQFRFVYKQLLHHLEWRRVASLTEAGQKYSEYISIMHLMLQESGITFIANRKFPRDTQDMGPYLTDLREKNARIIIADLYEIAARAVMCEAFLKNMTARQGYVWFLPEWFSSDWYTHTDTDDKHFKCKPGDLMQALDGHLALSHAYFANDSDIMQEGITVKQWRQNYRNECRNNSFVDESDYAGYAYDAVWTYALGLDKLLTEKPSSFQNFHSGPTNRRFVEILKKTNFNGVSGNIQFVGPSRISIILVKQWRRGEYHVVGHFEPNVTRADGGRLMLYEDKIQWLTPDGRRPVDGSSDPCDLQPLADLLNTTCENAMIAVNIMLLVFVLLVLVSCVLFYKRRYDQKVLRLRELGLANEVELRLDEWEVKRENVVMNRQLGKGAFGTVYGGEAMLPKDRHGRHGDRKHSVDQKDSDKEWRSVAVKTLKPDYSLEEKLDFLSEAEVMKQFNHINIVQLLGVCTRSEPILTVMEYMLYGDLKTFLLGRRGHVTDKQFKDENNEVSNKKLTSMARDVACALSYLADRKYVHRDIACRNCLVNAQHVVKLADFGMTRSMCENDYYRFNRKGMLPVRWMAPESLADGVFTPASDMWSYGVLLFEIITFGSFPFQGVSNAEVLEQVRSGNHVDVPHGVKPELSDLLLACWSSTPEKRPEAKDVVERLAAFPRLISPCLDAPLSVVQLDGQDTHEVDLNSSRKHSLSLNSRPPGLFQRATSHELADIAESERLMNGTGGGGWPVPSSPLNRHSPHHARRDRRQHAETTNV